MPRIDASGGWADMIRRAGLLLRRQRQTLGFSQDDLARKAGVSQGAVSRTEKGSCLSTPLVTYGKLWTAVLREWPADRELAPDYATVRALLALLERGGPVAVFRDPGLATLVDVYRTVPAGLQPHFVAVMQALAAAMQVRSTALAQAS